MTISVTTSTNINFQMGMKVAEGVDFFTKNGSESPSN